MRAAAAINHLGLNILAWCAICVRKDNWDGTVRDVAFVTTQSDEPHACISGPRIS
jgi:hypothetical protein